jgi:hypothetical protein
MSQTETILLVVLGFALATLLALFMGRLLWTAALRLGARRMQRQVPSTLVGLQTERDRLRAEYAMLSQRLSQRLETAGLAMAEQMAEVSRHRNRLEELETRLAASESAIAERDASLAALRERTESLTAELAAAVVARDALQKALDKAETALAASSNEIRDLLGSGQFPVTLDDDTTVVEGSGRRLQERIGRLTRMASQVARDRTLQAAIAPAEMPLPEAGAEPAAPSGGPEVTGPVTADDLREELEKLDAEWSRRLGELDGPAPPPLRQSGGIANVISLANRIRALHKDIRKD